MVGYVATWLRGSLALLAALTGVIALVLAVDTTRFTALQPAAILATVNFSALDDQTYTATVVTANGDRFERTLSGDVSQLQLELLAWDSPWRRLSLAPRARVLAISSRYLQFSRAEESRRADFAAEQTLVLDRWSILDRMENWLSSIGIQRRLQPATTMPLADQASYRIIQLSGKFAAQPANLSAEVAMQSYR